jgi:hypothetical protein
MSVQYRQGDVLLIKLAEAEADALHLKERARPTKGRLILAHGEATGHSHSIDGATASLHELRFGERHLTVWAPTELTHEEHAPIQLDPGFYRVIRQREFVPTRDTDAWVRD